MATPLATEPVPKPLEIRAVLRHGRFSSYKAREVLDLIRGKSVAEARAILAFTERGCAVPILKLLESAIANAGHNHDLPPEELFVSACFADEGPTLRRYRPRARGRGARIRKRTCHITIVLGRYTGEELARLRARNEGRRAAPADARAARARRVARSRRSGEAATGAAETAESTETAAAEDAPPTEDAATDEETAPAAAATDEVEAEQGADAEASTAEDAAEDAEDAASDTDEDAAEDAENDTEGTA